MPAQVKKELVNLRASLIGFVTGIKSTLQLQDQHGEQLAQMIAKMQEFNRLAPKWAMLTGVSDADKALLNRIVEVVNHKIVPYLTANEAKKKELLSGVMQELKEVKSDLMAHNSSNTVQTPKAKL